MNESPHPILIEGKLSQPELGAYLPRTRLYDALDSFACPLVLIQADAGYGKTTMVASYLHDRCRRALWYNITAADRLPGVTAYHLQLGLAKLVPPGEYDPTAFHPDNPELTGIVLGSMLERCTERLTLVFDEYDQADEQAEVHPLVISLVDHLPAGSQLLILCRGRPPLPIARLMIDGRAVLVSREQLAFDPVETQALFEDVYGSSLGPEELYVVSRRLEGWAAGLRMTREALLQLAEHQRVAFWAQFADSPALFNYLTEEVLSSLGKSDVTFLCRIAVFSKLQPTILDEVFPGCNSASVLEQMARRSLFTTRVSSVTDCYRYHSLFRHYLYNRLVSTTSVEEVRRLHCSAGAAYLHRDDVASAIGHSLAAGDYTRVSQLVNRLAGHNRVDVLLSLMEGSLEAAFPELEEACGIELCRLLPDSVVASLIPALQTLIDDLDEASEPVRRAHAQQRLGGFYHQQGRFDESVALLESSRNTFLAAGRFVPALVSDTFLSVAYLYAGYPEKGEQFLHSAISLSRGGIGGSDRQLLFARAEYALASGNFDEAEETALLALSGEPATVFGNAFAAGTLALALLCQKRPDEALQAARLAVTYAEASQHRQDLGFAFLRLAAVLSQTGRLAEAKEAVGKSLARGEPLGFRRAYALLLEAEIAHNGRTSAAGHLWTTAKQFWEEHGYQLHTAYAALIAPRLLEREADPSREVDSQVNIGRPHNLSITTALRPDAAVFTLLALGPLRFYIAGHEVNPELWGRAPSRRLFFYLLANRGRWIHRDQLLETLWPGGDPKACSNRLSVALHILRRELRPFGSQIERTGDRYRFQLPAGANYDVDTFVQLAEMGLEQSDEAVMQEACMLYRGDFLLEYPYDDFLENTRVHLHTLQTRLLTTIARNLAEGENMDSALDYYRRAHRHAPLLEEPVRGIMEVLIVSGEAAMAASTYADFRTKLEEETGAYPGAELGRLYQQALRESAYIPGDAD